MREVMELCAACQAVVSRGYVVSLFHRGYSWRTCDHCHKRRVTDVCVVTLAPERVAAVKAETSRVRAARGLPPQPSRDAALPDNPSSHLWLCDACRDALDAERGLLELRRIAPARYILCSRCNRSAVALCRVYDQGSG